MSALAIAVPYNSGAVDKRRLLSTLGIGSGQLGMIFILAWPLLKIYLLHHGTYPARAFLLSVMQTMGIAKVSTPEDLMSFLGCLFMTMALALICLAKNTDNSSIDMNADVLRFPSQFSKHLNGRNERLWSDVAEVVVESAMAASPGRLTMFFKSGGRATIDLTRVDRKHLEQLLLAIETRATNATKNIELGQIIDNLNQQGKSIAGASFTEIWEQSINTNFAPVSFMPMEPAQTLRQGKYKIVRQMSYGGFSAIYLALKGNDKIIVKEAALNACGNTKERGVAEAMLAREAKILLQLSHPQIVGVQDFFVENGRSYLVLDYLPGENLRQMINRQGPVDEETALTWARQLASILKYMHETDENLVHRDISPDNLMLSDRGQLTLIDFGAANDYIATATGTAIGKQSYTPPEQLRGKATSQSDIYGLGATLHFVLTGQDAEPLAQSHPAEANSKVSPTMDQLVALCTELDTATRFKSAEAVLNYIDVKTVGDGHAIKWKTNHPA